MSLDLFNATSFLGTPDIGPWVFAGLTVASFLASYFSVVAGTAGGLMLLVIMAYAVPPPALIPTHTLVQLGAGFSRSLLMWSWILKDTILPFTVGCLAGAALGAQIVVTLPQALLLGVLGLFVIAMTWMPKLGQVGKTRSRFLGLGFGVTLLGVFVSATGTIVGAFVASASPDRRNHVATMAVLMMTTHIAKMLAFLWVGFAVGAYLPLIVAMIASGLAGNIAGERTLTRMREDWFRLIFKLTMTLLALNLLWGAARGLGWLG